MVFNPKGKEKKWISVSAQKNLPKGVRNKVKSSSEP